MNFNFTPREKSTANANCGNKYTTVLTRKCKTYTQPFPLFYIEICALLRWFTKRACQSQLKKVLKLYSAMCSATLKRNRNSAGSTTVCFASIINEYYRVANIGMNRYIQIFQQLVRDQPRMLRADSLESCS